ncbi:MAG: hypothetical protein RMJ81_05700 [Candidatus Kryptonium sp.]|nr:hypothetical protein [Candidatus Kryptonium sp.]MDW8109133.1 hypothetical protein [Candidatus Kryptonium sp.]
MFWLDFTKFLATMSLLFFVAGLAYHYYKTKRLKSVSDFSLPKGSDKIGVIYAFTIGMLPWVKESTRKHWIAYTRGVIFHIGIFTAIAVLILKLLNIEINSSLIKLFATIVGIGAVVGFVGIVLRIIEKNLREISTFDDFISTFLVSLYLAATTFALINVKFDPLMYVISSFTLIYAPLGKIRHCLYFFFSRFFFGIHLGRRGIVHKHTEVIYGG